MASKVIVPLEQLNSSYTHKSVTCQGIVKELSIEYEDNTYGFIRTIKIQSIKKNYKEIGVQSDLEVIVLEENCGLLGYGDKIQVSGVIEVVSDTKNKTFKIVLIGEKICILNNEFNLSPQELSKIRTVANRPLIKQDLANLIFDGVKVEEDIKLIGTLILFCTDSPGFINRGIHCNLSLLLIGPSHTYKTPFLQRLKELFPNSIYSFTQKSEERFITYNSRTKKGGEYFRIAGLADLAKNGIILIDNLEYLNTYRINKLIDNFIEILRRSSIISAANLKDRKCIIDVPVSEDLQIKRKNTLLQKFDVILSTNKNFDNKKENPVALITEDKIKREIEPILTRKLLKKYIAFAKKNFNPIFTEEAAVRIKGFQKAMVRKNYEKAKFNKIDQQNLRRVIVLLSIAYTRIALKEKITVKDVQKILGIYRKSLQNANLI